MAHRHTVLCEIHECGCPNIKGGRGRGGGGSKICDELWTKLHVCSCREKVFKVVSLKYFTMVAVHCDVGVVDEF